MATRLGTLLTATTSLTLVVGIALLKADSSQATSDRKVAEFQLKDTEGRRIALADFKEKKAVVVVFVGTECPISNAYLPRLADLARTYAPLGVQFLAINSNAQDDPKRVADHALKHHLPFPVLKDEGSKVADQFEARRTPEAFVVDGRSSIRYRGSIDDQFGIGFKRPQPNKRSLADAIDAVLAGKPVPQTRTAVMGCLIGRSLPPKREGAITYTEHVARIVQKNCQECHRPGQIGPMPLLTYEDVVAWAGTVKEVVESKRMPPWSADPRYGHFANDRRLSDADRLLLLRWIDQGTPRGDDKDLPPPRQFVDGWTIGKPDLIVRMPRDFEVPAQMPAYGVPYQHFFVDLGFKDDRWVVRAEARAGSPEVVHHIVVFVVPPGAKFFPGNPATPALAGTAPGDMAMRLPTGMAKKIPAGSRLVFEMHYTPNGTAQRDRSSLGLIFARQPPSAAVLTEPIANPVFRIAPGDNNCRVEAWFRFKRDGHIVGFMPHMHLRGKDFLYEAIFPDGKTETLLSVPNFNFNWQSVYQLARPMAMPRGSRIHCIAHFDNSAANPNNPDPTQVVRWGDQTWEEMMIGWMDYVYDIDPEAQKAE